MKSNLVAYLTAFALTLGTSLVTSQPSQAQSQKFFCDQAYGYPATIVRDHRGNTPILIWTRNSGISDTWTPLKRCQAISNRFQDLHNRGQLRFLKAGRVNSQPVICGVGSRQASCNRSNVLLTVTPGRDPNEILTQILNTSNKASGQPVYLSGNQKGRITTEKDSDGFESFDLDLMMND